MKRSGSFDQTENAKRSKSDELPFPPPPVATPAAPAAPIIIDREKKCPLLLRTFARVGSHHRLADYQRHSLPPAEAECYTWMDADLRELTDILKRVHAPARNRNAILEFALVYPDKQGRNKMKVVGEVHSTESGPDDIKTLAQIKFQTGDYMDVAIKLPARGGRPVN